MGLTTQAHRAARRLRAHATLRLAARLARVDLDLEISPTADIGRIDVRFSTGVPAVIHIGAHTVLDKGVEIRLGGGSLRIADWCELRDGVRLMVAGDLDIRGQNLLSWGVVVHCDEAVTLGRQAVISEYATVTDSVHEHADGDWHLDRIRTAPVVVGENTWVGAKATVTPGVTVGSHSVVGAGAVVTRDVPDHHVAVGVPAAARPLGRSAQTGP